MNPSVLNKTIYQILNAVRNGAFSLGIHELASAKSYNEALIECIDNGFISNLTYDLTPEFYALGDIKLTLEGILFIENYER